MDDLQSRSWLRERILIDLRNIVKQVYHESVNNELSFENKTYICITLIKNLDEALLHGLKHLHLGYWKPICKVLHHHTLQSIEKLPVYNGLESNPLMKGRAWIAISLKDDSFISYIQCLISEVSLEKFYKDWSILRTSDACNYFLSILSGLDSVLFSFQIDYINRLPNACNFGVKSVTNDGNKIMTLKLNESKSSIDLTTSTTSLTSPVDSGVHIQDSTSDVEQLLHDKEIDEIDFLNGNVPEGVLLRKKKKEKKRHVSFHEDIMYKNPEKYRKLKWDSENLRYSWSGEQIDSSILKEVDFNEIKIQGQKSSTPIKVLDVRESKTPEGLETSCPKEQPKEDNNKSHKSVIVRRFLQSIKKQSKIRNLTKKYNYANDTFKKYPVDLNLVAEIENAIKSELESKPKPLISKYEVNINISLVKEMIRNQTIYKTYKLRDFLFIITNANIYLIKKNLGMKRISFKHINKVFVYPDLHFFSIKEVEEGFHIIVTGEEELTNDLIGKIEFSMRRNQFDPPQIYFLDYEDLSFFKKTLIDKLAIGKKENLVYCGAVYLDKETDLSNSILPTSKRGFLMYRNVQSADGWIPGDFCLKNGMLYLFEEESKFPKLAINIATACQSCYKTINPDRPHTFQISLIEKEIDFHSDSIQQNDFFKMNMLKSNGHNILSGLKKKVNKLWSLGRAKESGCVLELAAANECELCEWLQMIIQASCGDHCEEADKERAVEGTLWLTSNSLVVTSKPSSVQWELEIISCAQLQDVAAFRIGESERDFFTVIEFVCMEATASSGDWILYTSSREELMKLKSTLQSLWTLNNKFPCEMLKAGKLVTQLRKSQDSLSENYWSPLL